MKGVYFHSEEVAPSPLPPVELVFSALLIPDIVVRTSSIRIRVFLLRPAITCKVAHLPTIIALDISFVGGGIPPWWIIVSVTALLRPISDLFIRLVDIIHCGHHCFHDGG